MPHVANKWAKVLADTVNQSSDDISSPTFTQFVNFLKRQNTISENTGEILKAPDASNAMPKTTKIAGNSSHSMGSWPNKTVSYNTQTAVQGKGKTDSCLICPGLSHQTIHCRKFAGFTRGEKAKMVQEKNLCPKCLGQGHTLQRCPTKNGCDECGGPHHKMLHGVRLAGQSS